MCNRSTGRKGALNSGIKLTELHKCKPVKNSFMPTMHMSYMDACGMFGELRRNAKVAKQVATLLGGFNGLFVF